MGKVQCKSIHSKSESYHDQLINSNKKTQNWYEKKLTDEYKRLRELIDKKRKVNVYEIVFGQTDYKKQLRRMMKWSKIAYHPLPKDFIEKKKLDIKVFLFYIY